ncbi:MAG: glycosyltransferase [Candidatus Bathyarchaeia archaeon]
MSDMVSIIVTTLNEERYIRPCLKALKNQTYTNKEIILVDSESQDKTVEIAKKYADKIIIKNCIMPAGRNLGVREAHGNLLLFVDADVVLLPNWIDTVLPYLKEHKVVAAYGDLLPNEAKLKAWFAYAKEELSNLFLRKTRMTCYGKIGTAVIIKRNAFEKVGGFNEDYASCEDVNLSFKLRKCGKIKFVRDAKGYVSMRRFERVGYLKLSLLWWWMGSTYIMTGRAPFKKYSRDFP